MTQTHSTVFHPLATKISMPEYTRHYLERPRLEFPGFSPLHLKLVGIIAAAGYGKSTLMAQWKSQLERQGALCAWLNLDEEENDLANLLRYLVHGIYSIDPEACLDATRALEAGSLGDPKPIWQSMLHVLSRRSENYVLFLDDFHKITRKDVLTFTEWMIRHLPGNVRFVVASRPKLKLNINRLKSYGEVQIFGYEDLRFSLEETGDFLNAFHRFALQPEQIRNIHENSEGWVLVLQMISILAKRHENLNEVIEGFSGTHEEIGSYLGEVILDSMDSGFKEMIFKISFLDRFCADLVDEVLGVETGRQCLRQLQDLNLFLIPLDQKNHWFRFHHLFGEFLRENLRREYPGVEAALQRKASAWFEAHRLFPEAIEYALRAESFDDAGRLIAESEIVDNTGDTSTLFQWMQRLPKEYKIKYPAIWAALISSYYLVHNFKKANEEIALFSRSVDNVSREGKIDPQEFHQLRKTIAFLKIDVDIFNFKVQKFRHEILDYLEELPESDLRKIALKLCIGSVSLYTHEYSLGFEHIQLALDKSWEIRNYYIHAWVIALFDSLCVRSGKVEQAAQISRKALPLIREHIGNHAFVSHMVALHYAECLSIQGKVEEAWGYLDMPLHYLENWGSHQSVIACLTTQVRLHALQDDFDKALQYLQFGKKLGKKRKHAFLITYFKSLEIQLRLRQRDDSAAKKLFESLEEDFIDESEDRFLAASQKELRFISQARLALAQGQGRRVSSKLTEYVATLRRTERVRDLIEALVLQAAILDQDAQREAAISALVAALRLGAPGEFVLPFAEYRFYLRDFFEEALRSFEQNNPGTVNLDYRSRLIKWVARKDSVEDDEPLSQRELEILAILESGKSNKELARQLFISESTLKWHLYRLFRKFKVKNRTGLILAAKRRGVLS